MAAVAATEPESGSGSDAPSRPRSPAGALLAAALALPGIVPADAMAQGAEPGLIALTYLDYRDWQPGADRMRVHTPSIYARTPLSDSLQAEGSIVYDSISGASPLFYNSLSGASRVGITDYRTAGDAKLTKYFDRIAVGVGAAVSSERDYLSRAASLDLRLFSDDRNRTLAFGVGGAGDRIDSTNAVAENKRRHTVDLLAGITQALSPDVIVQSTLTYSAGRGYYSDPYKPLDTRPDSRRLLAWLTRYNQHLSWLDATVNVSYRYLHDSFGSDSHTVDVAWNQPVGEGWIVTPHLRYHTQSSADFYFDPPFANGSVPGKPYTADTRLSAFIAVTSGLAVVKRLPEGWAFNVKLDFYRQRSSWHFGGDGSPGLEPVSARWIQTGISKTF